MRQSEKITSMIESSVERSPRLLKELETLTWQKHSSIGIIPANQWLKENMRPRLMALDLSVKSWIDFSREESRVRSIVSKIVPKTKTLRRDSSKEL